MNRLLPLYAAGFFGATNVFAIPVHLAPNRATYELRLEHTSPGGAVAARGRLVIQFRDTCDGWSTAQRMIADMTEADGAISRTDFLITAWESKDGKTMRFDVKGASGGKLEKEKRGTATVTDGGRVVVNLLSPQRRQFTLPAGTIFPSQQTLELAKAAAHGPEMVKRLVFQGGDESDAYVSTALVGRKVSAHAIAGELSADKAGLLKNVAAWTMLVSNFANKRGADLPDYEVASSLYANGVSGSMSLIYARYTLRATLTRLEPLLPSCANDVASTPANNDGGAKSAEMAHHAER